MLAYSRWQELTIHLFDSFLPHSKLLNAQPLYLLLIHLQTGLIDCSDSTLAILLKELLNQVLLPHF